MSNGVFSMPRNIPPASVLRQMSENEAFRNAQIYEEKTGIHMDNYMYYWDMANRDRIEAERRKKHPKLTKFNDALFSAGRKSVKAVKKADKAFNDFMGGGKKKTTKKSTTRKTTTKKSGRCSKCGQRLPAKRKSTSRR